MTTKQCRKCLIVKPIREYHKASYGGTQYVCKPCAIARSRAWYWANHEKAKARARAHAFVTTTQRRDYELRTRYGLSLVSYAEMLLRQRGKCAICRTEKPGGKDACFHVDHCRQTKAVRGLLCVNCNNGLGRFKDSLRFLKNAVKYLER